MHGKRVGLLVQRQRYRCHQCRRTCVDPTPGPDDQRRVTERLKIFVAQQMLARPFTAVATEVDCAGRVLRSRWHLGPHSYPSDPENSGY
ncbi:MAG: hypothetical protein ACYCT0_00525 [Sulfobacillus sp.]